MEFGLLKNIRLRRGGLTTLCHLQQYRARRNHVSSNKPERKGEIWNGLIYMRNLGKKQTNG